MFTHICVYVYRNTLHTCIRISMCIYVAFHIFSRISIWLYGYLYVDAKLIAHLRFVYICIVSIFTIYICIYVYNMNIYSYNVYMMCVHVYTCMVS